MTLEGKAKAYDEALEKAKFYHGNCPSEPERKKLEKMFPVLRESEDEIIRKAIVGLIEELQRSDEYFAGVSLKDMLIYLEKQKEPEQDEGDFTIYHPQKNGEGNYECIPFSFYGSLTSFSNDKDLMDFLNECFYDKEECERWCEVENKPELPECKHKVKKDSVFDYLCESSGGEKQKEQNEITIEQVYKEFINPEKLKDAKTNKYIRAQLLWELMHNGIITEVDYQYLTDDKRKPWTEEEYLKAYRKGFDVSEQLKQKEQKLTATINGEPIPTENQSVNIPYPEWSEEEKTSIEYLNLLCDEALRNGCQTKSEYEVKQGAKNFLNSLKSLRPCSSWKPSEHQMTILKAVKEHVGRGSGYWGEGLGSLIEDLEKLM